MNNFKKAEDYIFGFISKNDMVKFGECKIDISTNNIICYDPMIVPCFIIELEYVEKEFGVKHNIIENKNEILISLVKYND